MINYNNGCSKLLSLSSKSLLLKIKNVNFLSFHRNHQQLSNSLTTTSESSLLEPCDLNLTDIQPRLKPTFNLAAYADKSQTLQQFIKLGVNLYQLEKKKDVPEFLLALDFDRDVKKYLLFLSDHGVPNDQLGLFLTKNPLILREDLDYLHARIGYLQTKKFSPGMISRVITRNPFWLMFSVERIDQRLGFFQSTFDLVGKEVRKLSIFQPKLITYNIESIRRNKFVIQEQMGFETKDVKTLLLTTPKLWMLNNKNLLNRFNYLHNKMNISHDRIIKEPFVLYCRETRLRERHQFLLSLDRAQYNPLLPNYVSLIELASGTDQEFATNVAKTTPATFNAFLKTM